MLLSETLKLLAVAEHEKPFIPTTSKKLYTGDLGLFTVVGGADKGWMRIWWEFLFIFSVKVGYLQQPFSVLISFITSNADATCFSCWLVCLSSGRWHHCPFRPWTRLGCCGSSCHWGLGPGLGTKMVPCEVLWHCLFYMSEILSFLAKTFCRWGHLFFFDVQLLYRRHYEVKGLECHEGRMLYELVQGDGPTKAWLPGT